jgi:hypothetical protein
MTSTPSEKKSRPDGATSHQRPWFAGAEPGPTSRALDASAVDLAVIAHIRHMHTAYDKNFSTRASYRRRSTGILAAPEQQPTLAGARNRSTTCLATSAKIRKRA